GEMSYHLMKHGIKVLGIDISPRESLKLPEDYPFIQMNIAEQEIPFEADVILFLSVYHHLVYNYGLKRADEVFYDLLSKSNYLVFDSGHPQERGIYRQSWVSELRKYFSSEEELLNHFSIPYRILGKWKTVQGDERTIVVFSERAFMQ
ncbi:MAG: class I SAM-dependent methyltransferase, partial [Pseudothermotoga sp.]|nr:class I SAM-dependent methyltransferase [Pseudothermotoga sp.]